MGKGIEGHSFIVSFSLVVLYYSTNIFIKMQETIVQCSLQNLDSYKVCRVGENVCLHEQLVRYSIDNLCFIYSDVVGMGQIMAL